MNPPDDWQLVEEYASSGSHAAFDALVKRHAGWIYATARRRVKSADLAEDVTQATFIVLARKARSIRRRESLAAWLYRVANYAALDALRRQGTRRRIERLAAKPEAAMPAAEQNQAIAKYLDGALDSLNGRDREAIILRYFNDQTLEQIGRAQRVAASTVQRRLERSLAQIGYQLKRNGVVTAPAAVVGTLAAIGTYSAPSCATAGLTAMATAAGALPANTAGPIGLAKGTLKTMAIIKLRLAAVAAIGLVVLGTGGVAITRSVAQPVGESVAPPVSASDQIPRPATAASDSASQYSADWQTIDAAVTHANPAVPKYRGAKDARGLTVRATLTILDSSHLLGVDRFNNLMVARILDEQGHDLTALATQVFQDVRWYMPLQYNQQFDASTDRDVEVLEPYQFNAYLNLDNRVPTRFASIEGYLRVLAYDHTEHVDVSYVSNGPPTTLMPGARLHFASAIQNGNSYSYQLVTDESNDAEAFDGQVREGKTLPPRIIAAKFLVDSAGNLIAGNRHAFGSFGSNGPENGAGGVPGAAKIAAMRFEIAVGLHEVHVPVTLRKIDVPQLTR